MTRKNSSRNGIFANPLSACHQQYASAKFSTGDMPMDAKTRRVFANKEGSQGTCSTLVVAFEESLSLALEATLSFDSRDIGSRCLFKKDQPCRCFFRRDRTERVQKPNPRSTNQNGKQVDRRTNTDAKTLPPRRHSQPESWRIHRWLALSLEWETGRRFHTSTSCPGHILRRGKRHHGPEKSAFFFWLDTTWQLGCWGSVSSHCHIAFTSFSLK